MFTRSRFWQAACLEEEIIRVLVLSIGLPLANLILRDRLELDGSQILPLEVDISDYAFPVDRLVELYLCRRRLKNEIAQIEKNWPATINLDTVQERSAVHHDDIQRLRLLLRASIS